MFTKVQIYQMSLNALLLQRQVIDVDTDKSNEVKVLNANWDMAWLSVLSELDLNATSSYVTLALVATDPNPLWRYAYAYPSMAAFFRRVRSCTTMDNRYTHIGFQRSIYNGSPVIFTNEANAVGEIILNNLTPTVLTAEAVMCVVYRLAHMSAPLNTGKGSAQLRRDLEENFVIWKAKAQARDALESVNFEPPYIESEWVADRMS